MEAENVFAIDLIGDEMGYASVPCPECGRFRLVNYSGGKQICEKCNWCPQDNAYIDLYELLGEKMRYEYDKEWEEALANAPVSFGKQEVVICIGGIAVNAADECGTGKPAVVATHLRKKRSDKKKRIFRKS